MVIGLLAEGVLPLRLSSGFHGITGPLPHYSMVHLTGLSFEKNSLDPVMTGALPRTPASSRELAGTGIYFFRRSGVRITSSGSIFRSPKAFIRVPESIMSANA